MKKAKTKKKKKKEKKKKKKKKNVTKWKKKKKKGGMGWPLGGREGIGISDSSISKQLDIECIYHLYIKCGALSLFHYCKCFSHTCTHI